MQKYKKYLHNFCAKSSVTFKEILFDLGAIKTTGIVLEPKSKSNKVILFFHSLGADKYFSFIELFTFFLNNNFTVCSIDWNGHGTENDHLMTYPEVINTPRLIADWFNIHHNSADQDIFFLGHSLGGSFCLTEAANKCYGGIITISTPYRFDMGGRVLLELLALFHKDSWRQLRFYSLWELLPAFHTFKRKQYPIRSLPEDVHYIKNVSSLLQKIDVLNNIQNAKTPYLNIHGTLDAIIPYNQASLICKNYGGPLRHVALKRNNHFTTIYNTKTVAAIAGWLKQ